MFLNTRMKSDRLNPKQRIVVVVMDILLLAEIAFCMYQGQKNPDYMTIIFLKLYLPMLLITVLGARLCIKRFRTPAMDADLGHKATG